MRSQGQGQDGMALQVENSERTRRVSREMSAIFAAHAPLRADADFQIAPAEAARSVALKKPGEARASLGGWIAGLIAAVLIGAGVGMIAVKKFGLPPAVARILAPTPAPIDLIPPPADALRTMSVRVLPAAPAPAAANAASVQPAVTAAAPPPRPAAPVQAPAPLRAAALGSAARPTTERPSLSGPCGRLAGEQRSACLYSAVRDADARWRSTFNAAIDARVPAPVLDRYRDARDALLESSTIPPERVVAAYANMTSDLRGYIAGPPGSGLAYRGP